MHGFTNFKVVIIVIVQENLLEMSRSSEIFCQASVFSSDPWNLPKNYPTNFPPIQPHHSDFQSTCHSNQQTCREVFEHLRQSLDVVARSLCDKPKYERRRERKRKMLRHEDPVCVGTDDFVVDFSLHFDWSTPCNYFISHGPLQVCERSRFSRTRQLSRKIAHAVTLSCTRFFVRETMTAAKICKNRKILSRRQLREKYDSPITVLRCAAGFPWELQML